MEDKAERAQLRGRRQVFKLSQKRQQTLHLFEEYQAEAVLSAIHRREFRELQTISSKMKVAVSV